MLPPPEAWQGFLPCCDNFSTVEMAKITVDLEKCTGAGVCKDVCPMGVYDLVEMEEYGGEVRAQPTRMEDCILCMACVNSCPNQAITVEEE